MLRLKLYSKMGICIGLILSLSLAGSWFLLSGFSYFLAFLCLFFALCSGGYLYHEVTSTNRRLSLFLDACQSRDFTLRFAEHPADKTARALHRAMNRIVRQQEESQQKIEEQQVYYESILRVLTHEFRNSVTPALSLSNDLLKHPDDYSPETWKSSLEVIRDQMENLSSFLDAYHRLTHLPQPRLQEIPLEDLFRKLQQLLGAEPGSRKICYRSGSLSVRADLHLLTLVLINLLRNALQALEDRADGCISLHAFREGDSICLSVSDNGPGIAPEVLPSIFAPFFTTKPEGSGIGLSLAKRIVQMHGGRLAVSSLPDVRTEFLVCLPDSDGPGRKG